MNGPPAYRMFFVAVRFSLVLCTILPLTCEMAFAGSPSEKVTLQLAWKHQFQFAGYYAALAKGYYRDAGLDVDIVEGGEGRFAREELLSGRAEYGVAGAELYLHWREGNPFVVLAPIFQHSPSILLARADSDLPSLQDLIGKRVMLLPGKKDADILAAFLNEGVALESFTRLDQTYNLDDLIQRRTDAVSAYLTNEPWLLEQAGVTPRIISPRTYGVDFYSDCLFTTQAELQDDPERVKRFLQASLRGWNHAMSHPDEIIEIIISDYGVKKTWAHLRYEAEAIRKIMLPDLVQIGHMNPGRWQHIADTYVKLGMIEPHERLDDFLYDPHSMVDYTWLKWVLGITLAVSLVLAAIASMLLVFYRRLKKEIDERRRAQSETQRERKEWETTFDAMSDWICLVDAEKRIIRSNRAYRAIIGPSKSEVIGQHCCELLHGPDGPVHDCPVESMYASRERETLEYYDIRHAKWINITAEPVFDEQGDIVHAIHILRDVSGQKKLEAALVQSQKMDSLGTLAGGIAHEFNNILGIIVGNAELALDDLAEASQARNSVEEIKSASLRAKEVVQQIQRFVRKMPSEKRPGKLAPMVKDTLKLLRSTIPRTVTIQHDITGDTDLVLVSPTEINQVLINLCANAVQAMPEHRGVIDVGLRTAALDAIAADRYEGLTPGNYARLTVTDDGIGIEHSIIDRIFEPYFTTKDLEMGIGMGLSVVYGIVKSHDGYIGVHSRPGAGTTVEVLLPTVTDPSGTANEVSEDAAGGTGRILFVDDEPAIARFASKMLERLGYQVVAKTDSTEALALFRANPHQFDLVITDMAMPQMAGDRLAAALKEVRPDIPIILCTGYSDHMDEDRAKALGIASYILKPLERENLAHQIRLVLAGKTAAEDPSG